MITHVTSHPFISVIRLRDSEPGTQGFDGSRWRRQGPRDKTGETFRNNDLILIHSHSLLRDSCALYVRTREVLLV